MIDKFALSDCQKTNIWFQNQWQSCQVHYQPAVYVRTELMKYKLSQKFQYGRQIILSDHALLEMTVTASWQPLQCQQATSASLHCHVFNKLTTKQKCQSRHWFVNTKLQIFSSKSLIKICSKTPSGHHGHACRKPITQKQCVFSKCYWLKIQTEQT